MTNKESRSIENLRKEWQDLHTSWKRLYRQQYDLCDLLEAYAIYCGERGYFLDSWLGEKFPWILERVQETRELDKALLTTPSGQSQAAAE